MISDYQQAVDYLYQNLPMFQRVGAQAIRKGLSNTIELCSSLGNPQDKFDSIHIAGTNGKGSTSHMLAAVLQKAGYKTGLYTSPHLKQFTERIRVNGVEANREYVVEFVNKIQPLIHKIQPSFFEITVAMAFDYFASMKVDAALVEVGLGGRLDSTNIIHPVLSVITNIGLDHKDILGDTLEMIAREKAGIIKHEVPVVISERQNEVDEIFIEVANSCKAPIYFASDLFKYQESGDRFSILKNNKLYLDNIDRDLKGNYQQRNILGVVQSIDLLRQQGYNLSDEAVREGLANVSSLTGIKGRWQKLGEKPLIICDTGHNAEGIEQVVRQIHSERFVKLFIVMGMVRDKDIGRVLGLLPKQARYFFCQSKIPRALDAAQLQGMALEFGLQGEVIRDVNEAIDAARRHATADDMIFIGGSTFVVAEIDNL
jgi:dihydrofolate synthase/folylpolyglutamate synthase